MPQQSAAIPRRSAFSAGHLRWWMIGLVTVGTMLNYLARSSLAVAAPVLKEQLSMTTEQYSYIVVAFQAAYTVMQPIAGSILDFLGTRLGFALFAAAWGLSNIAHAFAGGWMGLAFYRTALGASEAAMIPGGLKVVAEWFPPKERTVATGWFNMGTSIGAMMAPPLVTYCILKWNWQSAFVVTGVVSLVWAVVWYAVYRQPAEHRALTKRERAYIEQGRSAERGERTGWREIIKRREFWSIALPRFLADPAWQTFNFFIPLYLYSVWHLDLKAIAVMAWLPFLAADLGSLAGGYWAPAAMRLFGVSLLTSRKIVMTTGALLMIGPGCMAFAPTPEVAIALFCIGGFAHQMLSGALLTLAADVFEPRSVATAAGMAGSAGWIGGLLFTFVVGQYADTYGYNPLFAALACLDLIGMVVLWTLLRDRPREAAPA